MKKKRSKGGEGAVLSSLSGTGKVLNYIGMAVICFISLFPVIWVFISSLKADPMAEPGFTLPSQICLDGYVGVFRDMHIMRYFFNSFKVAGLSVIFSIIIISMSAYVVARMDFKLKPLISALLMSTLFIPATAMTFPVYNLVNKLHINDSHAGLVLTYT